MQQSNVYMLLYKYYLYRPIQGSHINFRHNVHDSYLPVTKVLNKEPKAEALVTCGQHYYSPAYNVDKHRNCVLGSFHGKNRQ